MIKASSWAILACLLLLSITWMARADSPLPEAYQRMLETRGNTHVFLSPDQEYLVVATLSGYRHYSEVADANYFHAVGKSLHSRLPIEENTPFYTEFQLIHIESQKKQTILPPEGLFSGLVWSPDSSQFAAIVKSDELTLWRYRLSTSRLVHWSKIKLSAQFNNRNLVWLPSSQAVIVRHSLMTPSSSSSSLPYQAVVMNGNDNQADRVYRDLLDSSARQSRFRSLTWQQATLVTASSSRPLSSPSMLEHISVSPDGRYLLTGQVDESLDAKVKFNRLARRYEVIEIGSGKLVARPPSLLAANHAAKLKDGAPFGARSVRWLASEAATLTWLETDAPDADAQPTDTADAIVSWSAPFSSAPRSLSQSQWRIHDFYFTESGRLIYVDWSYSAKELRIWSQMPNEERLLLEHYNYKNKYLNAGDIEQTHSPMGYPVARSNTNNEIFFFGAGLSEDGHRPFVHRYATTGEKSIKYRSERSIVDTPLFLLDKKQEALLMITESRTQPKVLSLLSADEQRRTIYDWSHLKLPFVEQPPVTLSFKRRDGLSLSGDLYLPKTNDKSLLPAVIWVYPKQTAPERGQQHSSARNDFTYIAANSFLTPILQGVAVFDMSNFPVVEPTTGFANDTYIEQQIANSKAMVDALAKTGKIDTDRLLLMGHSYGAFSTLSLLAHTDYFLGAISKSGAYNRTLTPLGFQREQRNLWQAPELYQRLSPLFQADQINEPVLLIHGEQDQNPGTAVLQSRMMYQALLANGVTTRLVLLPHEQHNYRIKENLATVLKHQRDWIDTYLLH